MNVRTKRKLMTTLIILTILAPTTLFSMILLKQGKLVENGSTAIENNIFNTDFDKENDYSPNSADTTYVNGKYNLSEWWDARFRFRIGLEVEELEGIDRYEPVNVYLTFEDNEHFEDSARLVSFNATGADEWSNEIPIQTWNITNYGSGFVEFCTVTFLANVSASSNQTYFLYYNENLDNIGIPSYNTDFTSTLAGGKLTVTVGNLGDIYKVVLEEGKGSTDLIKDALNFHTDDSLSPERQLDHPSLSFLAHMDEGFGNYINDSTGNESPGQLINSPIWADGIVKGGVDFEQSSSQYAIFYDALESTTRGDPFNDLSTEFTVTAWIKPESISSTQRSSHRTYNCFMAKASDVNNDNFEVGVNNDGTIHMYLDTERRDTYANFGNPGDVSVGQWNFIAIRYDSGSVDVRINNNWYSSTAWRSAQDLDDATGSEFTIGSTLNVDNTFFDGVIDEVAVYNVSLSNQDIEDYKFGAKTSVIQSITEIENGEVFSRYEVNWTESFNMHVSDICTFYYAYNLWNIKRSLYFDQLFVGNETLSQITALNTYYDFSGLSQNQDFEYYYDNIYVSGLNNDGFTVENYTIVHDPIHLGTRNTMGIFVSNVYKTGEVQSFYTYFKGHVFYDGTDQTVRYTPGSLNDYNNNGNSNNKLHIEIWEFIDNVYTPSTQLFENMFISLKNPVNLYVYEKDSAFYSLNVNVTDIDGKIVPEAKITVWNAADSNINWTQYTNDEGKTTFTRLYNGSFIVNASYEKYGKPELTITSPQLVHINEGTVDSTGCYEVSFVDAQLTSLNLTVNRFNSTSTYQGPLEGAQVSFWRDEGAGPSFIGSENSDENGNVIFRWKNFTGTTDGNISFTVDWFEIAPVEVIAPGDLDGDTLNNYVTFYFYTANSSTVNCTFGQSFETDLTLTVSPDPDYNQMIGDLLHFQVYFTYSNETDTLPIVGATVTYDIKLGVQVINTQTLYFNGVGGGLYNLTINTSNPVETGVNWFSEIDYVIEISAFKSGFISEEVATSFVLDPRSTTLASNESTFAAYWGEFIIMDVTYTDVSYGGSNPIDGATLQYYIEEDDTVVGSLIPYGSNGRYQLVIATSDFPTSGNYDLHVTATKQNYQFQDIKVELVIKAIKSLINNTVGIYDVIDLAYKETKIFYFNYTIESSGAPLDAADTRTYEWTKEVGGSIVDSGAGSISDQGNGLYALDFDTESKEIAIYTIIFNIEKENYAQRGGILILNIIPREFNITLSPDFNGIIISTVSGEDLIFTLELTDKINGSSIIGANVAITIQGESIDFDDLGDGNYSVTIAASKLPEAFFLPQTIPGRITISNMYYSGDELDITIDVKMVEIFPGFPMFYFLMLVGAIVAVVGSLVVSRQIRRARIPTFVKKTREMTKNIKGRKSIPDSLLYPSKEEYIIKKLGDKWEMLGLSLEEILGLSPKKKNIPKDIKSEGGEL